MEEVLTPHMYVKMNLLSQVKTNGQKLALNILIAFIPNSFNFKIAELRYEMIKSTHPYGKDKKYSYLSQILTTKGKSADIGAVL